MSKQAYGHVDGGTSFRIVASGAGTLSFFTELLRYVYMPEHELFQSFWHLNVVDQTHIILVILIVGLVSGM